MTEPEKDVYVFAKLPNSISGSIEKVSQETDLDALDFWRHRENRLSVKAAIHDRIEQLGGRLSPWDAGSLLYELSKAEDEGEPEPQPQIHVSGLSIAAIVFSLGAIIISLTALNGGC